MYLENLFNSFFISNEMISWVKSLSYGLQWTWSIDLSSKCLFLVLVLCFKGLQLNNTIVWLFNNQNLLIQSIETYVRICSKDIYLQSLKRFSNIMKPLILQKMKKCFYLIEKWLKLYEIQKYFRRSSQIFFVRNTEHKTIK